MKEQLHTIPISDAMANAGECPFCYIEQKTEEHTIERISNLESGYCVISDSNDLTQMQLKIKSENIDTESYKPAIKITLNDKTVTMTNYSMYCMN